jgi:hypothetical protein
VQELKGAKEAVAYSTQQLARFKQFMLEPGGGFGQLRKLTASVAAAHAKMTTEVVMKVCSTTRSATKAFTTLRSQANAHTDANVRSVVLTIALSAQQAAESHRKAHLEGPVARAAVDQTIESMHTFHSYQQAFQAIAHVHICEKKAVTLQLCLRDHYRIMTATTGVSSCWEHTLQLSRSMTAARATILSAQKLVQIHATCTRVVNNKATAIVAFSASDSLQRHNSEVADLPPLASHAPQAAQMASAGNDIQDSLPTDPVRAERAKRTSTRVKTDYTEKNKMRLSTQSLSPQRPRPPSGGMQHSPSSRTSATRHKDTPHQRVTSAAADYSRFSQLLATQLQRMTAHHAAYMQEKQALSAANDELLARMHSLPQRLQARARSEFVPRTIAKSTRDIRSPDDVSALPDDEKRLAKTSGRRRSR